MNSPPTLLRRLICVAAFFYAAGASADCVDTVALTAQERDFYARANAVLKSFLRPAPGTERIRFGDSATDPAGLQSCKGDKKAGDFTPTVSRKYIWPDPKGNMADAVVTLELAINVQAFDRRGGNSSGAYGSPSPTRSAGLKVTNVEWRLNGSTYGITAQVNALQASLFAALDRDRLQALVGRPLPSVAESDAMAKRAAPFEMVAATPAAAPTPAAAAPVAATPNTGSAATPASAPASPAPTAPVAAPAKPASGDAVKDAADAVQKLRGLFGR